MRRNFILTLVLIVSFVACKSEPEPTGPRLHQMPNCADIEYPVPCILGAPSPSSQSTQAGVDPAVSPMAIEKNAQAREDGHAASVLPSTAPSATSVWLGRILSKK